MRMGTFRSTYPMVPESNQGTFNPHFAWFHPGNYLAALRDGFNPFQGIQTSTEGTPAIPMQSMTPMDEALNNVNAGPEPTNPAKTPKTSRETSDDTAAKEPKPKQSKKSSSKAKGSGLPSGKRERKNLNFGSYESRLDACGIPAPVCTCTGVPRQCYRWGAGGWQSSCCTTYISEHPLPMSTTRPGARVAGRKMSHGAYDKLLQRLAAEGYDLSQPVDLKDRWAKHGTNRFVTIK